MQLTSDGQAQVLDEYGHNVDAYEEAVKRALSLAAAWGGETAPPNIILASLRAYTKAVSIGRRMGGMTRMLNLMQNGSIITDEDKQFLDQMARYRVRVEAFTQMLEPLKAQMNPYM